jgi:aromatic ring-cleaving dioxygenase
LTPAGAIISVVRSIVPTIRRQEFPMSEATTTVPPRDPGIIRDYHAHVYYDPATRDTAARLRERAGAAFPQARLGRWHDELVGPHLRSMYQIAFPRELIGTFLPWLMLNRDGLTVLLHPGTGNDYADHTAHAAWLGEVLPLRLEMLDGAPK